jgi:hypothetical protein
VACGVRSASTRIPPCPSASSTSPRRTTPSSRVGGRAPALRVDRRGRNGQHARFGLVARLDPGDRLVPRVPIRQPGADRISTRGDPVEEESPVGGGVDRRQLEPGGRLGVDELHGRHFHPGEAVGVGIGGRQGHPPADAPRQRRQHHRLGEGGRLAGDDPDGVDRGRTVAAGAERHLKRPGGRGEAKRAIAFGGRRPRGARRADCDALVPARSRPLAPCAPRDFAEVRRGARRRECDLPQVEFPPARHDEGAIDDRHQALDDDREPVRPRHEPARLEQQPGDTARLHPPEVFRPIGPRAVLSGEGRPRHAPQRETGRPGECGPQRALRLLRFGRRRVVGVRGGDVATGSEQGRDEDDEEPGKALWHGICARSGIHGRDTTPQDGAPVTHSLPERPVPGYAARVTCDRSRADSNRHPARTARRVARIGATAVLLLACGEDPGATAALEHRSLPLEAICEAEVDGSGRVDVETDYLPHVVACENGGADFAALQAQAVAARTYLYYKIGRQGHIGDGQGDQVYSCGRAPGPEHIEAAASTAGRVLRYHGDVIAAFYVAGAIPSTDDCHPAPGDRDPTGTEHFVTYNEGRSGEGIEQTTLGWVNPQNWANRGCKSQNGADCLAEHGYAWEDIVRFYYGEDIEFVGTEGPCVAPPPAAAPPRCRAAVPPPTPPRHRRPPMPPPVPRRTRRPLPPMARRGFPPSRRRTPRPRRMRPSTPDDEDASGSPLDAGLRVPARTTTAALSGGCGAVPGSAPSGVSGLLAAAVGLLCRRRRSRPPARRPRLS